MTLWLGFAVLQLLLLLGAVDGLYLHLWRFRLFARTQSRLEHAVHTLRSLLIAPTIWLLYVSPTLHVGAIAALVAVDQIAMLVDVWIEPRSRRDLGGVPRGELLIHFTAVTLHAAALTISFMARAGGATVPTAMPPLAIGAVIASALIAALHLVLLHPVAVRWASTPTRTL
jgi:hypothetical protein